MQMLSSDPTYPLFPVLSFLGFVLGLVPLPWHLQAWNAGTCAFMLWSSTACLIGFINSIIWHGNTVNFAPVWCDISTKFLLGAGVGITASVLCISRRLHNIATVQTVSLTRADKRRAVIIDLLIAVGIPVLVMTLHYIVQPHRFDILEDIGCHVAVYNTLPAYFLVFMWPVLLGSISFIFSTLTLRAFWRRRLQFNELTSGNSAMNVSRYLRLMLLAFADMMLTVPIGIYTIYIGNKGVTLAPWISWEDTHYNFSRVAFVPAWVWRSNPAFQTSVELTRWVFPFSVFLFFALFGFASEARRHYYKAFLFVAKPLGYTPRTVKKPTSSPLPSWRRGPIDKSQVGGSSLTTTEKTFPSSPSKSRNPHTSFSSYESTNVGTYADVEKSAGLSSPTIPDLPQYSPQFVTLPSFSGNLETSPYLAGLDSAHFPSSSPRRPPSMCRTI